jgi:outer membrane protein
MAKSIIRALSISLLLSLGAMSARADDAPRNTVAVGYYLIFYSVHANNLSGPFTPLGLDVQNTQTPYLAYFRDLSTHFSLELAAGVPPLTKSVGRGPATLGSVPYNGQVISTVRWLAPSLLLRYKFFDETTPVRPYFGVGVNYVDFYDRNSTAAGNAAAGGPTRIELPSSFGIAGTAGLAFKLSQHFGATFSFSASRVTSHLSTITGDVVRTSFVSFNPKTLVLAGTYSF